MSPSRWLCPRCGGDNVDISLPTWYRETTEHELIMVETTLDAEISWWYCGDCKMSDTGAPNERKEAT